MRFKNKKYRTVHKPCKTCYFKNKIKCSFVGFDNRFMDYPWQCNKRAEIDWPKYGDEKDKLIFRHSQFNWIRAHREEARKELMELIHQDICFKKAIS